MEVKEAIKFLENIYDWNTAPDIEELAENNIPKIISLLQQGEKFEAMWEELEIKLTRGYFINHSPELENCKKLYEELKEIIEQKYFPTKEEK